MAQQTINVGTAPNDGTGTPLRTAFQYTNSNFSELYTAVGPSGNNIVVPGNATITGDLTVDTNTLKVVSASDVVGINTTSPLTGNDAGLTIGAIGTVKALNIGLQNTFARLREKDAIDAFAITTNITASNTQDDATKSSWKARMGFGNGNDNFIISRSGVGSTTFYDLLAVSTGSCVWYDGAGGTRMTLNSTGLGVGNTPNANFKATFTGLYGIRIESASSNNSVINVGCDTASGYAFIDTSKTGSGSFLPLRFATSDTERMRIDTSGNVGIGGSPTEKLSVNGSLGLQNGGTQRWHISATSGSDLIFTRSTVADRFTITSDGNVGIGVTPSAWASGNKFIDINSSAAFGAFGSSDAMMIGNAYWNGSSWIRKTANNAWRFVIESVSSTPTMTWQLAANGSAGSSITWTQAMTLDASGRLLVGTVTSGTSSGDGIVKLGTYGHCISQTGTSIASGSSVDLTVVTSGVGYQGFLSVANTLDANANARTQTTFSVFGRGASSTITQIATADGPTSGASFTVTTPSNGVIRITNTSGNIATISAQFFGGTSA